MKLGFFAPLLLLAACTTTPLVVARRLPSASTIYISPDGQLSLQFDHAKEPYTYQLLERNGERIAAVGVSTIKPFNFVDSDRLRGSVEVTFSADSSSVMINEDFSDASPNPRYILIQKPAAGSRYRVLYLSPPTENDPEDQGEFPFEYPSVRSLTRDAITFYYESIKKTRTLPISQILQTTKPRGAEEWPSEAYDRYHPHA